MSRTLRERVRDTSDLDCLRIRLHVRTINALYYIILYYATIKAIFKKFFGNTTLRLPVGISVCDNQLHLQSLSHHGASDT